MKIFNVAKYSRIFNGKLDLKVKKIKILDKTILDDSDRKKTEYFYFER